MKNKILKGIDILFVITIIYILFKLCFNSNIVVTDSLYAIIMSLGMLILVKLLKRIKNQKKSTIILIIITQIIMLMINNFSYNTLINFSVLNIMFIVCYYIGHKSLKYNKFPALILFLFLIPIYSNESINIITNYYYFLPVISLIAYILVDGLNDFNIRTIIITSVISVSALLSYEYNIIYTIISSILVLIIIFRNFEKIKISVATILITLSAGVLLYKGLIPTSNKEVFELTTLNSIIIISFLLTLLMSLIYNLKENNETKILRLTMIAVFLSTIIIPVNMNIIILYLPFLLVITFEKSSNNKPLLKKYTNIYNEKFIKRKITNLKKVSVVIPNYNYANYIIERIDSILLQTYPIYELIILDDLSKDNSIEVIEEKIKIINKEYPNLKVRFIKNKENSGNVFKQWKKAFKEITGDYLWIAEADDSCSNKFLEKIMSGFNDEKVIISYCESLTMNENNKILMTNLREWIDIFKLGKWDFNYKKDGKEEIKTTLAINNTIANVSSVVFKIDNNIPYEEYLNTSLEYRLAGDWYFYEKVLEFGKINYVHKSLNYHRMHSNSVTLTTRGDLEYKEIKKIQTDIMKRHKISKYYKTKIEQREKELIRRFDISKEELLIINTTIEEAIEKSKLYDEVLLSIIMPVYNTEPFLEKCLTSVVKYLPPRSELIIVNDGSPDNSDKIIDSYVEKNDKIKYYKKENGGLSSAKNFGLEKAKGKYIGFIDSDDWVNPRMFEVMLKKALLEKADVVYTDVLLVYDNGNIDYKSSTNYKTDDKLMKILDTPLMPASWNKIIKKELFKGLSYPEGLNNEDVAVTPIILSKAKKIYSISSGFYNYYQRTGSIQNSGFNDKRYVIFDTAKICFKRSEKLSKENQEKIKGTIYTNQILALLIYLIPKESKEKREKFIKLFCEKINEFPDYDTNKYVIKYLKERNLLKIIDYIKNKELIKLEKELKKLKKGW